MDPVAFMDQTCPKDWWIMETEQVYDPYCPEVYMVWQGLWMYDIKWAYGVNGAYGMWN
jgi:hypothetical protein